MSYNKRNLETSDLLWAAEEGRRATDRLRGKGFIQLVDDESKHKNRRISLLQKLVRYTKALAGWEEAE